MISKSVKTAVVRDIKKIVNSEHGYYLSPAQVRRYRMDIDGLVNRIYAIEYSKKAKEMKGLIKEVHRRLKRKK